MICELCGKYSDTGKKINIEGALLGVCDKCAAAPGAKILEEIAPKKAATTQQPALQDERSVFFPRVRERRTREETLIEFEQECVADFSLLIKCAREKKGLKQEQLSKMMNEPHTLIHRIESGRFEPPPEVAKKLERILGITLLQKVEKSAEPELGGHIDAQVTLGDMIVVRKKKSKKQ